MSAFAPVTVDDLPKLRAAYAQCAEKIGDISPLLCLGYGYSFCEADGLCWLKQSDGIFLPPMGDWSRTDWRSLCEKHLPAQTEIRYVPEALLKLWQAQLGDALTVSEDRGMWDYILEPSHTVEAAGAGLADFRRHMHQFARLYPDAVFSPITDADLPDLSAFDRDAQALLEARVTHLSAARADAAAFLQILPYWSHPESHLHGLCVRVNGQLAAVAIGEVAAEGFFTAFYKRCDYAYKGINAAITHAYAEMQLSLGITRTNLMQDENEENLRVFKKSLDPVQMLRKVSVRYHR